MKPFKSFTALFLSACMFLTACGGNLTQNNNTASEGSVSGSAVSGQSISESVVPRMSLFRRNLDFRTLFWIRIIGILIPFIVTIPIAFYSRSYWALIIGMIAQNIFNAIILTIKSTWKPKWFYSIEHFKGKCAQREANQRAAVLRAEGPYREQHRR